MSIYRFEWGKFVGLAMNDELIGFLSRLRKDARGNVMAMAAAMILPMIGLVGGAVDMSRLYATKTRLQAACDAGALAGRRTMGVGTWAASSGAANTQAQKIFTLNFQPGAFASENQSATYTEANGTVTGNAQADVPMTLMKVFGTPTSTINVSCTSMMVIPNTDVMFVLDTTGSMDSNDSAGVPKITGLKKATKCFYEALAKENTDAVCEKAGSTETPPSGGISSAVQLRFGFMPYATNVNVGKLLPTKYFADNWNYQSRVLNTTPQWTWALGDASSRNVSSTSTSGTPVTDTTTGYAGWGDAANGVTIDGVDYQRRPGLQQTACLNQNTAMSNTMVGYIDTVTMTSSLTNATPATPVYNASNPPSSQSSNFQDVESHSLAGYKYIYNTSGQNKCRLQKSADRTWSTTTLGSQTRAIVWTSYNKVINGYTYRQVSSNIAGLKKSATEWNDSVNLPINKQDITVKLSGQNVDTTLTVETNAAVSWNGCIEDAYEPQNVAWASGIPSNAYGAKIDLVPTSTNTQTLWAPVLPDAVWGRYDSNGRTTSNVTTNSDLYRSVDADCPSQAAKLQSWGASAFQTYVNNLSTGGNTYHDVGLVWGGRFLSPDGIFHDENWQTSQGASIYRHLVFMTDGDTNTSQTNYTSEGIAWWDRRQTSGTNDSDTDSIVNARFAAICTAIKAKGIVIWVISYGNGTNTTTDTNLRNCSSDSVINNTTTGESTRFFKAANSDNLISTFKSIANQISSLRLTS